MAKAKKKKQNKFTSTLRKVTSSRKYLALIAIPLAGIGGLLLIRSQAASLYQSCNGYSYEIPGGGRVWHETSPSQPAIESLVGKATRYNRQIFVAVRGTDNGIHYTTFDWPTKQWYGSWVQTPQGGKTIGSPLLYWAQGSGNSGDLQLQVTGTDHYHHVNSLGAYSDWSGWRRYSYSDYANQGYDQTAEVLDNYNKYSLYAWSGPDGRIYMQCFKKP